MRILWGILPFVASLWIALLAAPLQADDTPVSIESIDSSQGEGKLPIISGFGVGDYSYDSSTGDNSFASSALALSFFKAINDHFSVFGQLTTAIEASSPFISDELPKSQDVSTEIDNLQLKVATSASGPDFVFGKFDSPLGIERDDAPLNYQATHSFNFDFGRPTKFIGLQAHQAFSEKFEIYGMVVNGWDVNKDNNKAKTVVGWGMWAPRPTLHFGLGEIYGAEEDDNSHDRRATTVATFQAQPYRNFVLGAEANYSSQPHSTEDNGTARWYGVMGFGYYRFTPRYAVTVRAETFHDRDGVQTGFAQNLTSFTVSPQVIFGGGFYGIFRYLEHTSLRLPE
ncbi:MAG TPA: outer membrane beta-barrel protein, partial [Acidobacteriota bacterium]|nr:outer membrane beta-barrel protein [Acidobacteriota bacterium]